MSTSPHRTSSEPVSPAADSSEPAALAAASTAPGAAKRISHRPSTCAAAMAIAQFTVLEALRSRVLWLLLAALAASVGLSGLLSAIALTEARETQAALLATALRLSAVFLLASFVVTSMSREAQDKGTELLLALPLPRTAWLAGKLLGFGALALLPAALFGGLLAFFAAPAQAALWSASLLCELWIVAAFAVFCTMTMSRPLPALAVVTGFYVLSRSMGALQLLGHAPSGADSTRQAISSVIDAIAMLLPRLDQFTQTGWLLYATGSVATLAHIAVQTAIYLALLSAATAFDLHRKDF